jgi:hypothetical protein
MSKRLAFSAAATFAIIALLPAVGGAQSPGDSVELSRNNGLIGEQLRMTLRVVTGPGATVEVTPGTDSWSAIELVRVDRPVSQPQGDGLLWTIQATIAGFYPGETTFAPSVVVITGVDVEPRTLEPVTLTIVSTLSPDAELVLRPLAPPVAIEGAESPWLRPGIAAGIGGVALLVLGMLWLLARMLRRALRRSPGPPLAIPVAEEPALDGAERFLESDPVAAYRLMSVVVKSELARRYGLRATALTTNELRSRLEAAGADRWQARLVGGLLEECDAVIYAGYRPAPERRAADLTMAREIVEVA